MDFLRYLETDTAVNILARLDDTSDLIRASLVSHFWCDFGEYFYSLWLAPFYMVPIFVYHGFSISELCNFISRNLIIIVAYNYKWLLLFLHN